MLTKRNPPFICLRYCLLALIVLLSLSGWSQAVPDDREQNAVYVLKAGVENSDAHESAAPMPSNAQAFDFYRNLIFFPAKLNGNEGNFILDTGAPTLLLNARVRQNEPGQTVGQGAGGAVAIGQQKVESLEFAGQKIDRFWALSLDLQAMEKRTGRSIDGFIGYEQLWNRELRIDYLNRSFSIQKPQRHPIYEGRRPDHVFKLDFLDHLPIVTLRVGKRRLKFILDTGAAVNLLSEDYVKLSEPTDKQMNIQGIDGGDQDCTIVSLPEPQGVALNEEQRSFVAMNLDHLQEPGADPVAGILGSAFLSSYCVGIDYRRGKLYIWNPKPSL